MRILSLTLICLTCIVSLDAQVKTTLTQTWRGTAWQDTLQEIFTYDNRGLLTTMTEQRWNQTTASWVNSRIEVRRYNDDSTMLEQLVQTWDTIRQAWQNHDRLTLSYSSPRVCSLSLRDIWVNGDWQKESQFPHTYDKRGNPDKTLWLKWNPATGTWVNYWQGVYRFNRYKQLMSDVTQLWDTVQQTWTKERQTTSWFSYKSGSRMKQVNAIRIHNRWRNNGIFVTTYDGKGHVTSFSSKDWVSESKAWIEHWHQDYTNNADGSVSYRTSTRWPRLGGEPSSRQMVKYTYY